MSNALDAIAPSFRAAKDRWPDAPNLQAHYDDLSRTFEANGSSLLELCKSFVETVCITIVNELGRPLPASTSASTTEYLGAALDALGLKNERGSSALSKMISGHNKLADALTAIRNDEGSVAHGKDGFIDAISDRHIRVYLLSADTILSLVLNAYDHVEPSILHTREPHGRYRHHNERIDGATSINAEVDEDGVLVFTVDAGTQKSGEGISLRVPTSELLYCLDREAYIDVLRSVSDSSSSRGQEESEPEDQEVLPLSQLQRPSEKTKPSTQILQKQTSYEGKFTEKVGPLYDYVIHSLLKGDGDQAAQVTNFVYTLLNGMETLATVDWNRRDSTRSSVRLFVKRLLFIFDIDGLNHSSVDHLVRWLSDNIEG